MWGNIFSYSLYLSRAKKKITLSNLSKETNIPINRLDNIEICQGTLLMSDIWTLLEFYRLNEKKNEILANLTN